MVCRTHYDVHYVCHACICCIVCVENNGILNDYAVFLQTLDHSHWNRKMISQGGASFNCSIVFLLKLMKTKAVSLQSSVSLKHPLIAGHSKRVECWMRCKKRSNLHKSEGNRKRKKSFRMTCYHNSWQNFPFHSSLPLLRWYCLSLCDYFLSVICLNQWCHTHMLSICVISLHFQLDISTKAFYVLDTFYYTYKNFYSLTIFFNTHIYTHAHTRLINLSMCLSIDDFSLCSITMFHMMQNS